jgi:hypothetical protein
MKRLISLTAFSLTLPIVLFCISCGGSSSTATSSSSAPAESGEYFVCYTSSNAHGVTVSSVFHVPPADNVTMLEEPWAKDFRRFIGQSGDEGGISVSCDQVDPKNPDAAVKAKIDAWTKQGIPVKQVNYKYAG